MYKNKIFKAENVETFIGILCQYDKNGMYLNLFINKVLNQTQANEKNPYNDVNYRNINVHYVHNNWYFIIFFFKYFLNIFFVYLN